MGRDGSFDFTWNQLPTKAGWLEGSYEHEHWASTSFDRSVFFSFFFSRRL